MVHGGFRRFGNLSFINQFSKKWRRLASTASDRKGAKIQHDTLWFKRKKIFSKHQNKDEFKNLDDSLTSVVIFLALEPLQYQWPQQPQWPQWPQWPQQPQFIKKITDTDGWIIPGTQMNNTSPFLWNGSSKFQFFTDIWYLSVGGCRGQQMLLFQKLITEIQISKPLEPAMNHNSIKINDPSTLHCHLL